MPPETGALNYGLGKVVGDNETGFRGTNDAQYRMEGWDFIVAGGGLFNNLDYSFTARHEDGTFVSPESQPGGGSLALRRQYGFLKQIIQQFDFVHMRPDDAVVKAELPPGASVRALSRPAQEYLIYVRTGLGDWRKHPERKVKFHDRELSLQVNLPGGQYVAEWLEPKTCSSIDKVPFAHPGGNRTLLAPAFEDDLALAIRSK
jgi:hypothetical protein